MTDRDEVGRFSPGNRIWETRSSCGVSPKFDGPEILWAAIVEYFEWNDANPLQEAKPFAYEGKVTIASVDKMRAMTIRAMCVFLDISHETWCEWRKTRADLSEVIKRTEEIIYSQKFEGASAGLLNANIIARDLGLADKTLHGNDPDNPMPAQQVTVYQLPDNGRG